MTEARLDRIGASRRIATHDHAYSVREVAELFGTSEKTIWRLIKAGKLEAENLGVRCVRVFDSGIARYRERQRQKQDAQQEVA